MKSLQRYTKKENYEFNCNMLNLKWHKNKFLIMKSIDRKWCALTNGWSGRSYISNASMTMKWIICLCICILYGINLLQFKRELFKYLQSINNIYTVASYMFLLYCFFSICSIENHVPPQIESRIELHFCSPLFDNDRTDIHKYISIVDSYGVINTILSSKSSNCLTALKSK